MKNKDLIEKLKALKESTKVANRQAQMDKYVYDKMQYIAGIKKERLSESNYVNQLLKQAKTGVERGQEVTVQGKKIVKVIPAAGAFKTEDGPMIRISDLENPETDILIGGERVSLTDPKPFSTIEPSPEEKEKRQKDFDKRYGLGGGYETQAGFHTGD